MSFVYVSLNVYELISLNYLLQFFKTEEAVTIYFDNSFLHYENICYLFKDFTKVSCSLKLYLESNYLTAKSAEIYFAPLLLKNKLVDLDLSWNRISDLGTGHIASALKSNTSLLILGLNHCNISDEGIHEISESLIHNHTLKELGLIGNSFTDDGLMLLSAGVEQNRGIKKLSIDPDIDVRMKHLLPFNHNFSKVTGQGLQLFIIAGFANNLIAELDIGEFGAQDKGVKEAIKLINEERRNKDRPVLTLFHTTITIWSSDVL